MAKTLIQIGLRQTQSDICMYPKLDSPSNICGFAIVHVGDLLYTGASGFLILIKKTISFSSVGKVDVVTQEKGITFSGLEIQKGPQNSFLRFPKKHMQMS